MLHQLQYTSNMDIPSLKKKEPAQETSLYFYLTSGLFIVLDEGRENGVLIP